MNQEKQTTERQSLEEVGKQFENWRKEWKKGRRIPQRLWQAAAGLSNRHSVGKLPQPRRWTAGG